jgi:hypothetical protein
MVFEMPEEVSGQKNRNVLCQGRVIRSKDALPNDAPKKTQDREADSENGLLAASIVDYKFIH